ncbi:site-2 protease family protein [Nitrosomonas marina]|uniref:Zn-dependent protease (Includes SpoIVFB) n=1 Tax=Nitrosomonas marina TaxID=917 RepID=A0A1H8E3E6_9PROT|nr:site-2 protease family protein [Nitrosomonas marina]SEN13298.1 Zn-dependent protease (includes SpoIVFB) [Nitrosomonas marina]
MDLDGIVQGIAIYALPVIFAITMHEAAHGYVARYFGDFTAFNQGRISLNPVKHIDPVGTILVPATLFIVSKLTMGAGFLFGWAKPVPVNFANLRKPKQDMLWVAVAGPGANLMMAVFWALIIKLAIILPVSDFTGPLLLMGRAGIEINVILMVLNLLPLPPLDGGRMAMSLLPHQIASHFAKIEPYGFMILLVLLISGILGLIVWPLITLIKLMMVSFFGLYV